MDTLKIHISRLGRGRVAAALGLGVKTIMKAESEGVAPASWYLCLNRLAAEQGLPPVPTRLFGFKAATADISIAASPDVTNDTGAAA
jgi:hypothetical protein